MDNYNWINYFFDICDVIAKKSKDPSTKVGAVITNTGNSIISTGYNGFPIGVDDSIKERFERPQKYMWTAHAEENAICFAARNGVSLNGAVLYVNRLIPCARCTRLIIQSGIKKIYAKIDTDQSTNLRWKEENDIAEAMMDEAGVEIATFSTFQPCVMKTYDLRVGDVFQNLYDNKYYVIGDADPATGKKYLPHEVTKEEAEQYAIKEHLLMKYAKVIITKDGMLDK